MEDNFFDGADITVPVGTTVTWVQNGDNPHTTTTYDGLWDSGLIAGGSGGTFSFTFDEPGTYTYFCRPHEAMGMVGTVTVTGGGGGGVQTQTGGGATAPASMPETGGPRPASLIGVAQARGRRCADLGRHGAAARFVSLCPKRGLARGPLVFSAGVRVHEPKARPG